MRPKQLLKRGVARIGRTFIRPGTRRVILCYHAVTPTESFLSTRPDLFEMHMRWLVERCRVVPLPKLFHEPRTSKPIVAVTFDDGYEDQHRHALPILTRYGIPATFFLTAGFLLRTPAVVRRMAMLQGVPHSDVTPLDWLQVGEIASAGMAIGSHSFSHPVLARLGPGEVRDELSRSREVIGEQLGAEVDSIAYPFGKPRVHVTARTLRIAEECGYGLGAGVLSRGARAVDLPLALPRFIVDGDHPRRLEEKISGAYDAIGLWQEQAPVWAIRLLSPQDFQR